MPTNVDMAKSNPYPAQQWSALQVAEITSAIKDTLCHVDISFNEGMPESKWVDVSVFNVDETVDKAVRLITSPD